MAPNQLKLDPSGATHQLFRISEAISSHLGVKNRVDGALGGELIDFFLTGGI
jgi:hypothetical protein